jgi:hypothetical protein
MGWGDFLKFLELFLIEKSDVAWCDFLDFLELFFNRESWYGMRWFLKFLNYLSIKKVDVVCVHPAYLNII